MTDAAMILEAINTLQGSVDTIGLMVMFLILWVVIGS